MPTAGADILSTRDVARYFGVPLQTAVKVIERLGLARRIGRNRAVLAGDLDKIEAGLRALGWDTARETRPVAEAAQ